jgi:hypothetical protein
MMDVPRLNQFSSVGENILWVREAWAAAKNRSFLIISEWHFKIDEVLVLDGF